MVACFSSAVIFIPILQKTEQKSLLLRDENAILGASI